jgi:hypothetical protein
MSNESLRAYAVFSTKNKNKNIYQQQGEMSSIFLAKQMVLLTKAADNQILGGMRGVKGGGEIRCLCPDP